MNEQNLYKMGQKDRNKWLIVSLYSSRNSEMKLKALWFTVELCFSVASGSNFWDCQWNPKVAKQYQNLVGMLSTSFFFQMKSNTSYFLWLGSVYVTVKIVFLYEF